MYDSWFKDTLATMRAQGIEVVLDPTFAPNPFDSHEVLLWNSIQAFSYSMLRYAIRPAELRQYVEAQSDSSNAQLVFIQMSDHVRNSTYAVIITRDMLRQITTARLNLKSWTKSSYEYIVSFNQMFELYNKQQNNPNLHINEHMARTYMQNALSGIKMFAEVTERETDRIIMGGSPFSYEEYMIAVKSTASKLDVARATKSPREVNLLMYGDYDEGEDDKDDEPPPLMPRSINKATRKFRDPSSYAAQMDKETWNDLLPQTQETWDTLPKEEKAKILDYAAKRGAKKTKANSHIIEDSKKIEANLHDTKEDEEEEVDDAKDETKASISVNNVITGMRSEAHAGDPRRVMGTNKPSTKNKLEAMMHRMTTAYDSDSSDSSDDEPSGDEDGYRYPDFHMGCR